MNHESIEELERQMFASAPSAPSALRDEVLRDVRRELRASTWDRRLARAAVLIVATGAGLNAGLAWRGARNAAESFAGRGEMGDLQSSLVETAIAAAEATDAETGRLVARQLAALSGRALTAEQTAAIDAAIRDRAG